MPTHHRVHAPVHAVAIPDAHPLVTVVTAGIQADVVVLVGTADAAAMVAATAVVATAGAVGADRS